MSSQEFLDAASYLSNASSLSRVSNATKLELYGLFKCATVATAPVSSRPSLFDMAGRAKWDAWKAAGERYSVPEAEQKYIELAFSLGWGGPGSVETHTEEPTRQSEGGGGLGVRVSVMATPELAVDTNVSALHDFAAENNVQAIRSLFDKDPSLDVNAKDPYGYTALHLASDRGSVDAVKILLQHGADVSIEDEDGLSAIELAQIASREEVIALLTSR